MTLYNKDKTLELNDLFQQKMHIDSGSNNVSLSREIYRNA